MKAPYFYFLVFISWSNLFCGVYAAECPVFPSTVTLLNLDQHLGSWGIHGLVLSSGTDPGLQCISVDLSAEQLSPPPVNIQGHVTWSNVADNVTGMAHYVATVPWLARPYQWDVMKHGGGSYKLTVLDSGYVDYSLMIMCSPTAAAQDPPAVQALLASRGHNQMPQHVVDHYLSRLRQLGISTDDAYFSVPQSHALCHGAEHEH